MASYYVRADGSAANKAAATSDAAPETAMSLATANVQAYSGGDRIFISDKGGAYNNVRLQPPSSGISSAQPVEYFGIGYPVINGDGTYALLISSKNYLVFRGLIFQSVFSYIFGGSHDLIFRHTAFRNSSTHGLQLGGAGTSVGLYNCAIHSNGTSAIAHNGLLMNAAGPAALVRNCAIYGNAGRGIYSATGAPVDYDYNLIGGNNTTLATNITVGADSVDGGHNVIEGVPGIVSYKANAAYFVLSSDDNMSPDGTLPDASYWVQIANALASYGVPMTFFARTNNLSATGRANMLALHQQGHEIAAHAWSHSHMTATQAFAITTTNANPTCNVDVAGHQIVLGTTTPGNAVTLDWAGDKTIFDLQTAVAGKGWTITPNASPYVETTLMLSSLADSGGAQAVPYTALLDRVSTNKGFFYDEITRVALEVQSITGVLPTTYAFPGNVWDAGAQTYLKNTAGIIGARAAGSRELSSLNIYDVNTQDLTANKGDGTETTIRNLARHWYTAAMERGQIIVVLAHKDIDFTTAQWVWFVNELKQLGAHFASFREAVASIRMGHTTADGITYTKTYPDNSCYLQTMQAPGINAGVAVAEISTDFFGQPVPFGAAPDIGLHEYQQAVSDDYPSEADVKNGVIYGEGRYTGTYGAGTAGDTMRQRVIDALKTRLQMISIANGYRTDLGAHVEEWDVNPLDPNVDALKVDYADEAGSLGYAAVGEHLHTLPVTLRIRVQANDGTALSTLRKACADVYQAIYSDVTFGGLAQDANQDGNISESYGEAADRAAGAEIKYMIEYTTVPGSP